MYSKEVIELANLLHCKPEDVGINGCNIMINNDIFNTPDIACEYEKRSDIPEEEREAYKHHATREDQPKGWIGEKEWSEFAHRFYDDYWLAWVDMIIENLDLFIEEDAIKLKER